MKKIVLVLLAIVSGLLVMMSGLAYGEGILCVGKMTGLVHYEKDGVCGNRFFPLPLPKGDKGDPGPQGEQGIPGIAGLQCNFWIRFYEVASSFNYWADYVDGVWYPRALINPLPYPTYCGPWPNMCYYEVVFDEDGKPIYQIVEDWGGPDGAKYIEFCYKIKQ